MREKAGMSQEVLADICGITSVAVSRAETGSRNPSLRLALEMAKALGCSIEDIWAIEEDED